MSIENKKIYLFLDDYREPFETFLYTKNKIYKNENWVVVRDYNEFVEYITENGLPYFISFDHDLADEHYVPQEYWVDYKTLEQYHLEYEDTYKEKTGLDCAKWVIDFCLDNKKKLPLFSSHSMNPVGRQKIISILTQFNNYQKENGYEENLL